MKIMIALLMLVFTTMLAAQAVTLPYEQNFDASSNLPEDWTIYISDGTSAYVAPYPAYYHSEPYCLYFWNSDVPLDNSHIIAAGPYISSSDFNNRAISFWALGYSEYDMPSVRVGFLETDGDPTSFTEFNSYTLSEHMSFYTVNLDWVRTDYQIAFQFVPNDGTQGMSLDDVYIGDSGGDVGTELPYFQNFDDSEDWPEDWQPYVSDESNEYINLYGYYSHSDPWCVYYWKANEPQSGDYMFVGGPILDTDQLDGNLISFWASCYTNSTYPSISVGHFDSPGNPESFYEMESFELTEDMQKFDIEFYPVRSIFQLAFRFNATDAEQGLALDDVYIGEPGGDIQVVELPYMEDFDEAYYDELPDPWFAIVNSTSEYTDVNIGESYGVNESNCMYLYNSSDASENLELIAVGPAVSDTLLNNNTIISFQSMAYTDDTPAQLSVGCLADPSNAESFQCFDTITLTSDFTEYTVDMNIVIRGGVYVAFKHEGTGIYQEVYVDDVMIYAGESEPETGDLPFQESFSIFGFPPAGWSRETVSYGSGNGYNPEWSAVIQNTYPNCVPYEGDAMGIYNGSAKAGGQQRLITPGLDVSSYNALRLEFWVLHSADYSMPPFDLEGIQIQMTTDGSIWENTGSFIKRSDPMAPAPYWKKHVIDLSELAGNSYMKIAMLATSMFSGYSTLVDDFRILESTPQSDQIYISEISDNQMGQADNTGFIELYNNASYDIDLSGLKIRTGYADAYGQNFAPDEPEVSYTIPDGTVISGGGIVVIGCGASEGDFINAWGIASVENYLPGSASFPITNYCAYELYIPDTRAEALDASPVIGNGEDMVQTSNNNWATGSPSTATPNSLDSGQTLPVEFTSFYASIVDNHSVLLTWQTASESDIMGYQVLRNTSDDEAGALYLTQSMIPGLNNPNGNEYYYEDAEITDADKLFYWILSVEMNGASKMHGPVSVNIGSSEEEPDVPEVVLVSRLNGNFPNPFNPTTTICFDLAGEVGEKIPVTLDIYNLRGQKVKTLIDGPYPCGKGTKVLWDGLDDRGKSVSSGVYFYRLATPTNTFNAKALLLK